MMTVFADLLAYSKLPDENRHVQSTQVLRGRIQVFTNIQKQEKS